MKRMMMVTGVVVVALVGSTLFARGAGMGPRRVARLELTEEQQQKVEALQTPMRTKMAETQAKVRIKRAELQLLWMAEKPDKKSIMAKMDEVAALQRTVKEARVDFRLAFKEILTPEQQSKLLQGHRGMRHGHRGMRQGRRGKDGRQGRHGGRRWAEGRQRRFRGRQGEGRGHFGPRFRGQGYGRYCDEDGDAQEEAEGADLE